MDTTTEAVEDHLNAAMLNEVEYGVTVDLLRALAVERDTLAAKLAELRPTEGAPDEAETFACTLDSRGTPWASGCASLMRQMASELRGYRKAVTWGVDTVAEAYRLDAEKLRNELANLKDCWDTQCTHVAAAMVAINPERMPDSFSLIEDVPRLVTKLRELEVRDAAATHYRFGGFAAARLWPNRDDGWRVLDANGHDAITGLVDVTKDGAIARAKALSAGEVKP